MRYVLRGFRRDQHAEGQGVVNSKLNILGEGGFTKTTTAKSVLGWSNPNLHARATGRGYSLLALYKECTKGVVLVGTREVTVGEW